MRKQVAQRVSEHDQLHSIRRHLISLKVSKKRKSRQPRKTFKKGSLRSYYCKPCKVVICTQSYYPKCYKCRKETNLLTVFSL